MTDKEMALIFKLLTTYHLNVPERGLLPEDQIRSSAAKEVITKSLDTYGWFPGEKQYPVGHSGGSYFQIEKISAGKMVLHENYEYGFSKFEHRTTEYTNTEDVVVAYLKAKEKEGLDGLSIDWNK